MAFSKIALLTWLCVSKGVQPKLVLVLSQSLLGSCMGFGHRVVLLRDLFGFIFGDIPEDSPDPNVNVSYEPVLNATSK